MMKRNIRYATGWTKDVRTDAILSKFIASIDELEPGPVVLYLRVSTTEQKANLADQRAELKWEVERRGFSIIEVFEEIVSGWDDCRTEFKRAVHRAKAAGAIIVAESVDRIIRRWPTTARLRVVEMQRLMIAADGVQLATLIHPDTSPSKVRGHQTKRGQAGKGNRGGRPPVEFRKKARRLAKMPKALALRDEGWSYRRIGRKLGVPWSTVRDWTEHKKPHRAQQIANHR